MILQSKNERGNPEVQLIAALFCNTIFPRDTEVGTTFSLFIPFILNTLLIINQSYLHWNFAQFGFASFSSSVCGYTVMCIQEETPTNPRRLSIRTRDEALDGNLTSCE